MYTLLKMALPEVLTTTPAKSTPRMVGSESGYSCCSAGNKKPIYIALTKK